MSDFLSLGFPSKPYGFLYPLSLLYVYYHLELFVTEIFVIIIPLFHGSILYFMSLFYNLWYFTTYRVLYFLH